MAREQEIELWFIVVVFTDNGSGRQQRWKEENKRKPCFKDWGGQSKDFVKRSLLHKSELYVLNLFCLNSF